MAKPKTPKTLDEETFTWIKNQKSLNRPGRPPSDRSTGAKRRQRYFNIRNVAQKEIADLTRLANMLPKKQLKQIFTWETLKPVVEALLHNQAEPDPVRAQIAQLFIEEGFGCLVGMKTELMTKAHLRTTDEATDLANYIVESLKPDGKRFFHSSYPGAY
jgi:hypothetical protein